MLSGILASAVSEFLDSVRTERDFDVAFVAHLMLNGYGDIHCVHGQYEFGKDFIAKKCEEGDDIQFVIQTKKGNIDSQVWKQQIRPQCDTMVSSNLAHPSFDESMKRRLIVATTGDFVGQAGVLAQEYKGWLEKRGGAGLEFWCRAEFVESMAAEACLGSSFDWAAFGHLLWEAKHGDTSPSIVERYTRRWLMEGSREGLWRSVLEFSVIRDRLVAGGLGFHAVRAALGVVRAMCQMEEEGLISSEEVLVLEQLMSAEIRRLCEPYAKWAAERGPVGVREDLASVQNPCGAVEISVRCLLGIEVIGLATACGDLSEDLAEKYKRSLEALLSVGASRKPLSDEYAISVLIGAAAAKRLGIDCEEWLIAVGGWIEEAYSKGIGLSPVGTPPSGEIWRTAAPFVECPGVAPRVESTLCAAVMDACSVVESAKVYEAVHGPLLKAGVIPCKMVPVDGPGQFEVSGGVRVLGGEYPPRWEGREGWRNAPSHDFADKERAFDKRGSHWVGLAVGGLIRDRWWLRSLHAFAVGGKKASDT